MLSVEQRAPVESDKRHIKVNACAGSGKTRVIVSRAVHLINSGINSSKIVVIAYTNSSAHEIRERISAEIENHNIFVGTINAYALKVLIEGASDPEAWRLFNKRKWASDHPTLWSIVDEEAVEKAIRLTREVYGKKITLKAIRAGLYSDLSVPASDLKLISRRRARQARVKMRSSMQLSQEDIVTMLADGASALEGHIEHLLIDEAQDLPYEHLRFLDAVAHFASVFTCQDDAQAIFGFLSKKQEALGVPPYRLVNYRPDIFTLATNYRSKASVVQLANEVREKLCNRYNACTMLRQEGFIEDEGSVSIVDFHAECSASYEESIPQEVLEDIAFHFIASETCALLCRTWKDASLFKPFLQSRGLVESDELELSHMLPANRGALALARVMQTGVVKLEDLDDFKACDWSAPSGSILKQTAEVADLVKAVYLQEMKSPISKILAEFTGSSFWSEMSSFPKTVESLFEVWHGMGGMASPLLQRFADHLDIKDIISGARLGLGKGRPKKLVTTVHGAKGLEFETVIVYGVSDGIYPCKRDKTLELVSEAGRCLYTAITRSKDRLILLRPLTLRQKARDLSKFLCQ